jgi:hypothetical protein
MTNASDSYNELQTESSPETGTWSGVVKSPTGSYKAQIFRGKMYHLGTFKTPEEAHMVYLRAKHVLHSPLNRGIPTEELLAQVLK